MMMKKSVSAIAAAAMLAVGLGMPTAAFAEELSKGATTTQTAPDGAQVNDPATTPGTGDEAKDPATTPGTGDEGATPETPGGAEGEAGNGETTDTPEDQDQVTKGTVSVFGYDGKELVATYTVEDGEVVYGDVYAQGEVISPDDVDGYLDSAEGLILIGFEDAATGARFGDEDTFFGLLKKQSATTLYGLYGESFDTPLEDTVSVVTDLAGVYIDTDKDDKSRFEGENGFSATKNYLTDANTALRISTGAKVRFHGMQKALDNGWAFAGGLADTDTDDSTTDTPAEEGIAAEGEANGWDWQVLTSATVTEDLKGRKVIRVPLKLTNNTGKVGNATNALGVTAWQDGNQLDPASIHSEEAEDDWNAMYGDTQPGVTVNTAGYFYLDSDSPIEVRIDEDLTTLTGKLAKVTYNADGSYAGKAKAAPAKDTQSDATTPADYVIPNGAAINGESGSIDGVAYILSKGDLRFNYQFLYDTPMSGDLTVDTPNADATKTDSDKLANTGSSILAVAIAAIVVVAAAIALVVVKMVRGKKAAPEVVDTTTAEEAPKADDAKAEEAPKSDDAKAE